MVKRFRQSPNDLEPERLPQGYGARVRSDYKVELHSTITALPRVY